MFYFRLFLEAFSLESARIEIAFSECKFKKQYFTQIKQQNIY